MDTYRLHLKKPTGEEEAILVPASGLQLGRSPECDVVLFDRLVSRHHAWVGPEVDMVVVRDQGSRNGIEVNGKRCTEHELNDGDTIKIGEHNLLVKRSAQLDDSTAVIPIEQARKLQEELIGKSSDGDALPVLYRAARLLGETIGLEELLSRILDLVFSAIPIDNGYIITWDGSSKEPMLRAQGSVHKAHQDVSYSRTVLDHVFSNQTAVLTDDAKVDDRFTGSESLMNFEIKQIMCAPLIGRERCAGAIYVDCTAPGKKLSQSHLELLTALGQVVGVAVENAALYAANLEKERLAAIGEATAGLGHCVKNILTGMKAGGEYMDMAIEQEDLKWAKRGWPVVKRASDRIEMLMMNLLTYSRERTPAIHPCDINDLCIECAETVEMKAKQSNTTVTFERAEMGLFACDGREIYRVILNLLTNAIEACADARRDPGKVHITARIDDEGCYVTVVDNGTGIPEDIRPRLSEAFVSSKGSAGTGLGLACSYKIAREHGGEISFETAIGTGTTFTLFIPVMQTISVAS